MTLRSWLTAIGLLAISSAAAFAAEPAPELVSIEKIWDAGRHNAFTDLIRFQDRFWCTFREADGHVGGDGKIRILVSEDGAKWESAALLTEERIDLRDPKLSITPGGMLMCVMGGSVYDGKTLLGRQPRVAFSSTGHEWSAPKRVLTEGDWLWRVTWKGDTAYGAAYRTVPRQNADGKPETEWLLSLYSSPDGQKWTRVTDLEVPNRANETTLRFVGDEMIALARREQGNQKGWIGASKPPYTEWKWHETEHRFGGPNFIAIGDDLWAGSRSYPGGAKTVLARMSRDSYEPVLTFPSGGDTSYPGFVWHDGLLWMSYYSSHEGKTAIYLAKIRLE